MTSSVPWPTVDGRGGPWLRNPGLAADLHPHVMGCASIAGLYKPVSAADATAALTAAWQAGVRAFDTAPHYGAGQSEERLGAFLAGRPREAFTLSTKVGRILYEDPDAVDGTDDFYGVPRRSRRRDYSAAGVRRSYADSLARLGLDRVDVLLVHDPEDHMETALCEAVPELARMRAGGEIRGFGVGTNFVEVALEFVRRADIDTLMIAGRYSLLDRRAEVALLDECAAAGVAVQVAGVLNSGLLADPYTRTTFNYAPAPAPVLAAARAMAAVCQRHQVALRTAAMQFPLRHPAVTAIVSGPGSARTVTDTVAQQSAPVPEELWAELDALVPDQADLP